MTTKKKTVYLILLIVWSLWMIWRLSIGEYKAGISSICVAIGGFISGCICGSLGGEE